MNESLCLVDPIMAVMESAFDPAFGEAWNRRQIADALAMPSTHALVIDEGGRIVGRDNEGSPAGFVLTRHAADEEELLLIAVMPEYRKRGLGKLLIDQFFAAAKARGTTRVFLEMRRGNPAIELYRKTGFEPIGERPNYYRLANGSRVDAITFGCSI
ncbi:GNAT family N-acetyltransferase [Erythrobacter ani]|uniref:GNAT family N-acetyltransferase n=1 Tax=Erythrobacter ani TaxID=2827235 RepID=A0ABS6SQD1_9SPHN|nr:GNAT family N-acetyltransferase [Erythrobacter ani]MBV7266657.1 GNAT family N-acetyltransferase [Erythrobacter ani]